MLVRQGLAMQTQISSDYHRRSFGIASPLTHALIIAKIVSLHPDSPDSPDSYRGGTNQ
jgi:hypothetical protein